ncbi:MAG: class I SAM-dependent methyltransferase [Desulfomonile sp.]|nr:class I SAM-dependent methyltransferase [Desulfomonile sp.]
MNHAFHTYFQNVFRRGNPHSEELLEIGCAGSFWLPYFAAEYGFKVTGIDYSELGCELARRMLERQAVEGTVLLCDLFSPPSDLVEHFDYVISFGVVEHFEDTADAIRAASRFLKPGGHMITIVPNLAGILGFAQSVIDRDVWRKHVILNRDDFESAHLRAGLRVLSCTYFLAAHSGVVNFDSWKRSGHMGFLAYILVAGTGYFTSCWFWALERAFGIPKPNRITSPYIVCLAKKS